MKNLNEEVNKIKHLFNFKQGDLKKLTLKEDSQKVFYHGGLPMDATISDIDVLRPSKRQQKKGSDYAGFYMSPDMGEDSFAFRYHKSIPNSGLHRITMDNDSKGYEYDTSVERIPQSTLRDLISKGYDYISGKNVFGKPEFILLNTNKATLDLVSTHNSDDDKDGIPNRLDIDDDNDGVLDPNDID
jgi:hypothetical protein